ncbi:hypothetical protein ACFVH6_23610 [Spirillospora sp. NPDC127200]
MPHHRTPSGDGDVSRGQDLQQPAIDTTAQTGDRPGTSGLPNAPSPAEPVWFAFYGCAPDRSHDGCRGHARQWHDLCAVRAMIEPHGGQIVTQYFDLYSTGEYAPRYASWIQRPQARALVQALRTPVFDAVAVADLTAFDAASVWDVHDLLAQHGKQLWVADNINGRLNPANPVHVLLVKLLTGAAFKDGRA